jgi:aminopeptidase N
MKYSFKFLAFVITAIILFSSCSVNRGKLSDSSHQKDSGTATSSSHFEIVSTEVLGTVYRPERTKIHRLIHTRLDVSFDWEKRRVLGEATLQLSPYFFPQKELELDAKNFDIHRLGVINGGDTIALEYDYDNMVLTIELDRTYYRDESFLIYIDYTAKPYERETSGSMAIQSNRGLFFVNHDGRDTSKPRQIWTQGETEHNSGWFPTIDSPNQRSTQEMYITVDDNFVTLSNGLLIASENNPDGTRTDYWKQELSHTPYLFMVAVGEFAIVKDYWEGIEVSYYVEPAYEPYARAIFGNTPEMLTFFSDLLGYKYPWAKYAQVVVRDFVSGAMENTTASVFMEDLQIDDRELLDYHWDGIIAHELIHHWFGNLVTCESWANLPLNEAFGNYGEYLWYEYKYGMDEADYHNLQELNQYLQESQSKKVDLIRFYYDDKENMFDSHSYAKGGRILHMLRNYLGDTAFFESLKHYLHTNEYSDVEVHDLRLSFEKVTGKDMNWFFNQWFLASGHPQIKVDHSYENGELTIEVRQMQDKDIAPVYRLPVDIAVWVNSEKRTFSLELQDEYHKFVFPVEQKPDLVLFDGKHQMLAEIEHEKTNEEMVFQYYHSGAFLPRYQALEYLSKNLDQNAVVILDALDDPFWGVRQFAIGVFDSYKGEHLATLERKIRDMAVHDDKSVVRADALSMLSIMNLNGHKDLFLQSLNDSSYSVIGVSLMALSESDIQDKAEIFSRYEHLNNLNVFLPIASYYARNDRYEKYDWFDHKVKELKGTDLWYMLQFFGEYLMNAPEDQKERGVAILAAQARNNGSYYIRLAAYQALGLLEDVEGVANLREDIRKNETDNRLSRIYSNLN